jgi:xylulokinase
MPSGTLLGKVHQVASDVTGLPVGTPVVLGGHDFLCGCLPVGAFKPGVVLDVTGTWEIIVTASPKPILTDAAREMGWWIDSHVARDMYAPMGSAVAADMLEWFRRLFGFEEAQKALREGGVDWDYLMATAAEAPAGCDGVMFLPHMSGSTVPVVDAASRGAFIGLRNTATKGHMLRAVVEGLNYQFLQILAGLDRLGLHCDKLVTVGGGTKNEFWMQNRCDMLGQPFEVPEVEEATPLGAAILAGIGVGVYRDEQEAFERVYRSGRVFEPNTPLTAQYAERFKVFEQLYPALRNINRAL